MNVTAPKPVFTGKLDPAHFLDQLNGTKVATASYYYQGFPHHHPQVLVATDKLVGPKEGFASFYDAGNAIGKLVAGKPSAAAIVKAGDHFYGVEVQSYWSSVFINRAGDQIKNSGYDPADLETEPGYKFGSLDSHAPWLSEVVDGDVHLSGPQLSGHTGKQ